MALQGWEWGWGEDATGHGSTESFGNRNLYFDADYMNAHICESTPQFPEFLPQLPSVTALSPASKRMQKEALLGILGLGLDLIG